MLLEHDRLDVGQVDDVIDNAEFRLGIFRRDLLQRGLPGEADGHDRREAVLGELAQDLLALRLVLDLEIAEIDAGLLLEPCRAVEHALVERFVELAAKIIKNGGLNRVGRIGRGGGEKTSGKSRRRHERDATEHMLTSVWRERLPSPRPEKLTGWSSKSARNLTVKRGRAVPAENSIETMRAIYRGQAEATTPDADKKKAASSGCGLPVSLSVARKAEIGRP